MDKEQLNKITSEVKKNLEGLESDDDFFGNIIKTLQHYGYGSAKSYIKMREKEAKVMCKVLDIVDGAGLSPEAGAVLISLISSETREHGNKLMRGLKRAEK